ncbi:MAG: hypothetical protein ACYTF6_08915, partial [Planctomycetota bacterium]
LPASTLAARISEAQARKIIDHLGAEGFLASAKFYDMAAPEYKGPTYTLRVAYGKGFYEEDLGWGLAMLNRLDGLRAAIDGDAAKAMDKLLAQLERQRKEWEKAATQPATRPATGPRNDLTLEMFLPYLNKQHSLNDVMRAFPHPHFYNGGGLFSWATYKLSDGTSLIVGQHGKASATLRNAKGDVIRTFPFGTWNETSTRPATVRPSSPQARPGKPPVESLKLSLGKFMPEAWRIVACTYGQTAPVHWEGGTGWHIRIERRGYVPEDWKRGKGGEVRLWIMDTGYAPKTHKYAGMNMAEGPQTGAASEIAPWHGRRVFRWGSAPDWLGWKADIAQALAAADRRKPAVQRVIHYDWSGFSIGAGFTRTSVRAFELDFVARRGRRLMADARRPQPMLPIEEKGILKLLGQQEWMPLTPQQAAELRRLAEQWLATDPPKAYLVGRGGLGREDGRGAKLIAILEDSQRATEFRWRWAKNQSPPPPEAKALIAQALADTPENRQRVQQVARLVALAGNSDRILIAGWNEVGKSLKFHGSLKGDWSPGVNNPVSLPKAGRQLPLDKDGRWIVFLRDTGARTGVIALQPASEDWFLPHTDATAEQVRRCIPQPEPGRWQEAPEGDTQFALRPRQPIAVGEPIPIEVHFRNTHDKNSVTLQQLRYNIYDYYPTTSFAVITPEGQRVTLVKPEGPISEDDEPRTLTLGPHGTYIHTAYLDTWTVEGPAAGRKAALFSKPGVYGIRCILSRPGTRRAWTTFVYMKIVASQPATQPASEPK